MFFENKGKILIFFAIFLIISISPINAELIHESFSKTTNNTSQSLVQDKKVALDNSIDQNMNNIGIYVASLSHDANYAKSRADDYSWKFWKWSKITSDIVETLNHMTFTVKDLNGPVDKLTEDTGKSKTLTANNAWVNTNDSYMDDASCMANNLSVNSNTEFTVDEVEAHELKKGDIVQYVSNGYPRYLAVTDVINANDVKLKNRNSIDTIPYLLLIGIGTKMIEVNNDKYIILKSNGGMNTEDILKKTVQLQQSDINKFGRDAREKYAEAKELRNWAWFTFAVSGFIALITLVTIIPSKGLTLIVGGPLSSISGIIGAELYLSSNNLNDEAKGLEIVAANSQKDLNYYTCTDELKHLDMNVTTFEDIPIVKKPPVTNWKECTFLLVKKPEHGTVLPGPGIQFLYGPYEGYTGKDTFTFQYIKNGAVLGTVNVNITVNSTPVLTVPEEE